MDRREPSADLRDQTSPVEPGPMQLVIDQWLSDDPPWDREVLDNIDESGWRLSELRSHHGRL